VEVRPTIGRVLMTELWSAALLGSMFFFVGMRVAASQQNQKHDGSSVESYWIHVHERDDRDWSQSTKMSVPEVRKLREAAGIDDHTPDVVIERIWRVPPDERFLVTTSAETAECMTIGVYRRRGKGFQKLWAIDHVPGGGEMCAGPTCPKPLVVTTKKGRYT
jgi:hypothetical protein